MSIQRRKDSEEAFLASYDPSAFDRPSVAVDIAVLTADAGELHVALYKRREHPQRGCFALPGGFVRIDESLDAAATRLLAEKVQLADVFIEQLFTFGSPKRDPRMRIVSVAYYALVAPTRFERLADDAVVGTLAVDWPGETGGPVRVRKDGDELELFVDHADMLGMAVKRLRGKLDYAPIGFQLLPPEFTLRELQLVHETVRGEVLNKDSFRRRMLNSGQLEATGERERDVSYRPAELYRFVRRSAV